ncbi:MAG: hypothetical protein ACPGUC_09450 [Gammaproteobacteria bacterium]
MEMVQFLMSLAISVVGLCYVLYGLNFEEHVPMYSGTAMMIYPFHLNDLLMLFMIGITLIMVPFLLHD